MSYVATFTNSKVIGKMKTTQTCRSEALPASARENKISFILSLGIFEERGFFLVGFFWGGGGGVGGGVLGGVIGGGYWGGHRGSWNTGVE